MNTSKTQVTINHQHTFEVKTMDKSKFTYTTVDINGANASTDWIDDFDVDAWANTEYWE